jgi:CRISPR/Cas system-associated protein Csm6
MALSIKPVGSNMTELHFSGGVVLFSYRTPVACQLNGKGYFRTAKKWSVTTSKHINKWLDGVKAEEKPQEFFDGLVDQFEVVKDI